MRLGLLLGVLLVGDRVVGMALDHLHPRVRVGATLGAATKARQAEADLLILGSSTALRHYDDEFLTDKLGVRVFNAGADGRGLLYARGILAIAGEVKRPKIVLFDLCTFSNEDATVKILAPYYGHNATLDRLLTPDWRSRVKLLSSSYRYNGAVLALLANIDKPAPKWGFEPLNRWMPADAKPTAPRETVDPKLESRIADLINDAHALGATVVLVRGPNWGDTNLNAADVARFQSVAKRLGAPFIDLSAANTPELQRASLYADLGHLNREGAAIFSRLVADSLSRLGVL